MRQLVVRGASVWRGSAWDVGDLVCSDGLLAEVAGADATVFDADGLLAVPGFVDLQCNGALGIDLAGEPERLWELSAQLPRWGVTAWLPTIVTTPLGVVDRALVTLAAGPPPGWVGAVPMGLHLEGPFLSPCRKGAHPEALLRTPSLDAIDGWSRAEGVALVTLAPELEGAHPVIEELVARGVVVSIGHSDASAAEASSAVDSGATWVTHLFNAMSPLHHREPGVVGAALSDERLRVGMIADGIHVHPSVVKLAQRALGERLVLVTDAVAALGMEHGEQALGRATVHVGADGVRLPDGTLAGSNLAMDQAVRNLIAFSGCQREAALHAASTVPAAVLGDEQRGTLAPGSRADVALLTQDLEVAATIVGGEVVHGANRR
ncbi:MAG: N-acetylglucosamine-6-phosphate deacetylase [Actinomycetota bacterium]